MNSIVNTSGDRFAPPIGPKLCVLPDIGQSPVLAPLPHYRDVAWNSPGPAPGRRG